MGELTWRRWTSEARVEARHRARDEPRWQPEVEMHRRLYRRNGVKLCTRTPEDPDLPSVLWIAAPITMVSLDFYRTLGKVGNGMTPTRPPCNRCFPPVAHALGSQTRDQ
jgi:hypothetical protein